MYQSFYVKSTGRYNLVAQWTWKYSSRRPRSLEIQEQKKIPVDIFEEMTQNCTC